MERLSRAGTNLPRQKPERGEAFRGLVYKRLSPVTDIVFEVGTSDTVRGTWIQKPVRDANSG